MDEKTMEKFLRKLTIIFVTICLVLMAVNWCFSHMLNRIADRELNKKMAVEMTGYQMELKRESDTNLRILSAVANFVTSEETICENRFVKSLCEECKQNVWFTRTILLVILLLSMLYLFIGYRIVRKNNLDLLKISYTDTLTGAGNMADFSRKLESVLQSEADFSVLAINIRNFKFINEIFGDIMANEFLCDIKEILEKNMTEKEFFCRETADKFYLCLNTKDREIIKQRFTAITEEVQKKFHWYHREYQITLYAGVVTSDELERTHLKKEEVMTHVMFALNRARNAQPDGLRFYDGELHQSEILRNYVESHMAQELKEVEFILFLQPQKKLN